MADYTEEGQVVQGRERKKGADHCRVWNWLRQFVGPQTAPAIGAQAGKGRLGLPRLGAEHDSPARGGRQTRTVGWAAAADLVRRSSGTAVGAR